MKKSLLLLLSVILVFALFLTGCSGADDTATETGDDSDTATDTPAVAEYTLRIPLVLADTHPQVIALTEIFKTEVEEQTDGKVIVEIYPNSQLGSDRETTEACMLGTLEMTAPSTSVFPGFDENFYVLDLPYLFNSKEAARNALDGDLGNKLNEHLQELGVEALYWGESGFRNMTNSKRPITQPSDLEGLKMRVMENTYMMEAFSSWGCNPTPMAFGELFTALQQGTVDGEDNATVIVSTSKFYEVQKYLSITEHIFGANALLINKELFDAMPAEYQEILRQAAADTAVRHRELIDELNVQLETDLANQGMEINTLTPESKQAFADASSGVKDMFAEKFGSELIDLAEQYNQ